MKLNPLDVLIETEDGSHTLCHSLGDHYHSRHGAIQEAQHVFIHTGLDVIDFETVTIFEVGFGTGLNAFLTLLYNKGKKIRYITIEPDPIDEKITHLLNYPFLLKQDRIMFDHMHNAVFSEWVRLSPEFDLLKLNTTLETVVVDEPIHLIYFDAFAPRYQPELWDVSIFEKCFKLLSVGGLLVTYCAKGSVKRNLVTAGFVVETCPGPPGKREMIRAQKL